MAAKLHPLEGGYANIEYKLMSSVELDVGTAGKHQGCLEEWTCCSCSELEGPFNIYLSIFCFATACKNVIPCIPSITLIVLQDAMVEAALAKARADAPQTGEPLDGLGMEGEEEEVLENDDQVEESFASSKAMSM